ncbi:MAG: tRNA (adenosine(37)-N6)-threonylcarbamoyltransferase complex transferase subunit TsaD [Spirochaetaceae bacterium]
MTVLGIESSCDECAVAVVRDGVDILSNTVASQVNAHAPFDGVVPELASRMHTELVLPVYRESLAEAGISSSQVDAVAVTNRPGLAGSLVVGLSFAKGLSMSLGVPFAGVDHILSHLYAVQLETPVEYPYLGVVVSGGHTLIAVVRAPLEAEILGTTIDDACGEAFDKVAKFHGLGYPGGVAIDGLARKGDPRAFRFPAARLHKGDHRYDVSYSGLKTAVVNQLDRFWNREYQKSPENLAASFEQAAIDMIVDRLVLASRDTGIRLVAVGGGVAANTYLRQALFDHDELEVSVPSRELCTDNAAMVAGLGYHVLTTQGPADLGLDVLPRVSGFRRSYP